MVGWLRIGLAGLGFVLAGASARAEDVAAFYAGKTLTVVDPFGEAGFNGLVVRLMAEHLPAHLPGRPRGIPQFMPGGGGLRQANYMANVAARDGSVIGMLYDNMPTAQILEAPEEVKFDARRFGALGSISHGEVGVIAVLRSAGVASLAEARDKQAVLGSTGTAAAQYIVPYAVNQVMRTRFKLIPGYASAAEIFLAMEKGEVDGVFTNYNTVTELRPQWVAERRFVYLAQLSDRRSRDLPDVPLLQELATDPLDVAAFTFLALGRVPGKMFIAPPDVPPDRLAALRAAFSATMRDPAFAGAITKYNQTIEPRTGAEAARVIADTVETQPAIVARVRELTRIVK